MGVETWIQLLSPDFGVELDIGAALALRRAPPPSYTSRAISNLYQTIHRRAGLSLQRSDACWELKMQCLRMIQARGGFAGDSKVHSRAII